MALQGALETFKLDEVLRLLGTSEKSGLLTLTGDRGVGRVWVERGRITQTEIDVDTNFVLDEADAVFHMLRFTAGDFLFDDGDEATASGEVSLAMDEVLDEAQARLDEWRDIVGTITGLESQVTLVATIDAEVTVDPAAWERLALVGSGVTIREMGVQLAEAELHTMRAVKELVERGLVDIDDTPAPLASDLATIEPVDVVESVTPFIAEPVEETAVVDQGQSVTPFIAEPVEETAPLVSAEPVEETAPL
ncbi:MAG: DUF4388 domain-containing protein, partial [Acidimicrobiia bacterium]|nr:DUF4388 domain-containing protein [Acidimicrobiia bacterium]